MRQTLSSLLVLLGCFGSAVAQESGGDTLRVNGADIFYQERGDGPPLLLLHFFGGCGEVWEPHLETLAEHYRLVIPDLPGHGRSTLAADRFTHRQAAIDIYALLDQLGIERFQAMGMSSGGMTLIHMATQQPERIESMVLIGATTYFPEPAREIMRQSVFDSMPAEARSQWGACSSRGDEQTREVVGQFHGMQDSYDDMNFTPAFLSTIQASTLIVHGDRDVFFPVEIPVDAYEAIPDAYLWIIPGGEHIPIFGEWADAFRAAALRFLAGEWQQSPD